MKIESIIVVFSEKKASRMPYFMGFTFFNQNHVYKGAFESEFLKPLKEGVDFDWGVINPKSLKLAHFLLEDCIGESEKVKQLEATLQQNIIKNLPRGDGTCWLIWTDLIKKWIALPRYGITGRKGEVFYNTIDKTILCNFPIMNISNN